MIRPDQERFEQNIKHFEAIDTELQEFCIKNDFHLEKNLYRTPCRVLRKAGNPELIFDIYQEEDWRDCEYNENLLHTFGIAAYYEPPNKSGSKYRLTRTLADKVTFSALRSELHNYLKEGLSNLFSWTPEVILKEGHTLDDLRKETLGD